jgi:hypothetical protein
MGIPRRGKFIGRRNWLGAEQKISARRSFDWRTKTALTLFLYVPILIRAHGGSEFNEALNYVADTLLYAGAALAVASALPHDSISG